MYTIQDLFDLSHTRAAAYLAGFTYPWEALAGIGDLIRRLGPTLEPDFAQRAPEVWVHKTAVVAPTAYLGAPCIIGAGTEVRHGAFIRGSALVGDNCVVGNSVELKNVILFDGVQTPHYNYVGDSIWARAPSPPTSSLTRRWWWFAAAQSVRRRDARRWAPCWATTWRSAATAC